MDKIIIKGAREHNLKNIDVVIPRDKLVVITGLSGSGKSSLAFDTIYAEGAKTLYRIAFLLCAYVLGRMDKPDVGLHRRLVPPISIDKDNKQNPVHRPVRSKI